jgi:dihydrofolate reductase
LDSPTEHTGNEGKGSHAHRPDRNDEVVAARRIPRGQPLHPQGKDVRLGGGVAPIRQYLTAGLIDEIDLVISPVLLGRGEHLLAGIDAVSLGYKCTEHASTDHATHVVLTK